MNLSYISHQIEIFLFSFIISLVFTPIVRSIMLKLNWIHHVDINKWKIEYKNVISMGGGISIFLGFSLPILFIENLDNLIYKISLVSIIVFIFGLIDDTKNLNPFYKIIIQLVISIITIIFVGEIKIFKNAIDILLTIFIIIGIMNSVNMMDNMDGLASGLVVISAIGYVTLGIIIKNEILIILSILAVGSALGFWFYNKPAANIFMGNMGSFILGYILAMLSIVSTWNSFNNQIYLALSIFFIIFTFIYDTSFVILYRKMHKIPITKGDKNHISHRLAMLFKKSEWKTNILMYIIQFYANTIAIFLISNFIQISIFLLSLFLVIISMLSIKLWKVNIC